MLKELRGISFQDKAYVMAMAVIQDRVKSLSVEDRNDLFEVTKEFFSAEDEESRESAATAMVEIIEQPRGRVRTAKSLETGAPDAWIAFIGRRILDLRKQAGMSQGELAAKSGLTQSHISRLENGEHSPTGLTLEKIATALGVATSQFDPRSPN